jgi:hypothetical protein
MVVDSAGNIYIADTGHGQIVEVNAQGTTSVLTISGLSPALVSPAGIAIDGSGNLYVPDADPANSRVVKVAVDVFGTVSIADTGDNRGLIVNRPVNAYITPADATYSLNNPAVGFGPVQHSHHRDGNTFA